MENKRTRIVCIHGFKGKPENLTYRKLKRMIPDAEIIAEGYDLTDVHTVFRRIEELKPDILAGNSLGGFYVLAYEGECKKIVVNPCLIPANDIPKLDDSIPKETIFLWVDLVKKLGTSMKNAFGIFSKDDELFQYKKEFDLLCNTEEQSISVEGTHVLKDPGLSEGLKKAFEYHRLENINKSV